MKIFVCVKQVPDTRGKVYFKKDGSLDRARMDTVINPDDLGAVEAALRLKDKTGAKVIAVTMGPPSAEIMLHELYAMGVDDTVLITARELGGSDTYGTSTVLAAVIDDLGLEYDDVIFCGRQAIDGDTAQVGPELAEKLSIAQLTYVSGIELDGAALVCRRVTEDGYMTVRVKTPCLIACMKEIDIPRYMRIDRINTWDAKKNMRVYTYDDVKPLPLFDVDVTGLKNAPTIVLTSFALPKKTGGMVLQGTPAEMTGELFELMDDRHVLG